MLDPISGQFSGRFVGQNERRGSYITVDFSKVVEGEDIMDT